MSLDIKERKEFTMAVSLPRVILQGAKLLMAAAKTSLADEVKSSDLFHGEGGKQKW